MQDSCSLSQLIFPINISLCAEEQAAVQLMIWITAACCPAIPAACWEPNSLRVLRSVTHAPTPSPPPPPSPLVIQWKTHCALMADAWHLPFSASHLSPCSPAVWFPLLSDFFNTPLRLLAYPLLRQALPAPLPSQKTEDVSFTTKVEMHPHHYPTIPPTPSSVFRHGVNTNEEEMSPLPCPHLSQQPRDIAHSCLPLCASLTVSHPLCHHRNLFQDK